MEYIKLRVLLIDPWGINNTAEYLNGLIYGLSRKVELNVFTNCYFEQYIDTSAIVNRIFFRQSEKMEQGKYRTVIRGIEYIQAYWRILTHLKYNKYDVVHINWLLNYKLDIIFLEKIKQYCPKIVYTAHNVLPHVNGENHINELKTIYSLVDKIILHGESIKEEFLKNFPNEKTKLYVQKHGCILREINNTYVECLPQNVQKKINCYSKIFLNVGAVFYNKGTDRIAEIWLNHYLDEDALLILGGRQMETYPEYEKLKPLIKKEDNMVLFDDFIDDDMMDVLFRKSSAIILPYRHASMSGIVFSAAQYNKTIICTNVGALPEYLENNVDSFICEDSYNGIKNVLDKVLRMSNFELCRMGEILHNNIEEKCDWIRICADIISKVYLS